MGGKPSSERESRLFLEQSNSIAEYDLDGNDRIMFLRRERHVVGNA